jgi:hypothetical protein
VVEIGQTLWIQKHRFFHEVENWVTREKSHNGKQYYQPNKVLLMLWGLEKPSKPEEEEETLE